MPQFSLDADLYLLEEDPFNDMLRIFKQEIMYRAVRKFLRAVLARIPVRTGFLRGAFGDIRERFSGGGEDTIYSPTSFVAQRLSKRARISKEYYYTGVGQNSRIIKTSRNGAQFATPADQVLTFSGTIASFNLDVRISYYRVNDFFSRIRGAPWNSLKEGAAAMTSELERAANFFPAIEKIATVLKIRLRGTSVNRSELRGNVVASRLLEIMRT